MYEVGGEDKVDTVLCLESPRAPRCNRRLLLLPGSPNLAKDRSHFPGRML